MRQHADSRRAHIHLDYQRAETFCTHTHLDSQRTENPRAQKCWSDSEYFLAFPKKNLQTSRFEVGKIVAIGTPFLPELTFNSRICILVSFLYVFCMQNECQRSDNSRATVHEQYQRADGTKIIGTVSISFVKVRKNIEKIVSGV